LTNRQTKEKGFDYAGNTVKTFLPTDIKTIFILYHVGRKNASKIREICPECGLVWGNNIPTKPNMDIPVNKVHEE